MIFKYLTSKTKTTLMYVAKITQDCNNVKAGYLESDRVVSSVGADCL